MGSIIRSSQRAASSDETPSKYLTFRLGQDVYGVEVLHIKKIIEFGKLTRVPMMPRFVRGVLNLLGNVVPVIDLAVCFGQEAETVSKRTCIVIVEVRAESKTLDMGIIVDAVYNVIELLPKDIAAAPEFGNEIRTNFIQGVGKLEEGFIMLLNMDHILSMEDLSALHRVQAQAENLATKTAKTDGAPQPEANPIAG